MDVDSEIQLLKAFIKRLGREVAGNNVIVTFGALFRDEQVADTFEAIVGTLRAAKRRNIVAYEGEMLLSPVHDATEITLLQADE